MTTDVGLLLGGGSVRHWRHPQLCPTPVSGLPQIPCFSGTGDFQDAAAMPQTEPLLADRLAKGVEAIGGSDIDCNVEVSLGLAQHPG